ncbi:hypothetical protein [Wenjunlia tyrosinilytica]|uniref:Secreted protein n=1 Tax=Wenjunlia tyrosinilytica TaxID=1544741 RepID=A0A918DZ93_9ACTN|nr:hypothetical protein [Wenjunlia tyrosinilytica]GGO93234.1 hypothetical protein GCM10012280_45290 [Wenjunlia tyrosinilytica]
MATLKRRTFAALTAGLGTAAASLTFASSAHADFAWHCNDHAGPRGASKVCVQTVPDGYNASVVVGSDLNGHTVDFNLNCSNGRWFGDDGTFPVRYPQIRTYVFKVGQQGECWVKLYDYTTGMEWDSPLTSS